jgi:BexC/CtrB/KpsE family polysaccharide export inner-membrane protein
MTVNDPQPIEPTPPRSPADDFAREMGHRVKAMAGSRPFLAYLAVVTVLTVIYFAFIASPLYVSESSFSIRGRTSSATPAAGSLLSAVTGGGGGGGALTAISEPAEIVDYISSPHMMQEIDKRHHIRAMYCRARADLINWMPCSASQEDFLKFYRKMVIPRIDRESFIIRLEVRSFDARSAHDIADDVLKLTADYVDNLSAKIRDDSLRTATREVQNAENEVRTTRLNMTRYRATSGLVDPTQAASAQQAEISTLQASLNQARAERAGMAAYTTTSNPLARQADAKIAQLETQLARAQAALASTTQGNTVAQKLYGYEGLAVANEYAVKKLESALQNYDSARVTASQRERFLVRAVDPNLPDEATLPKRILRTFEVIAIAIALYAIVALSIAGVRDHQGI